jgi:hypothetical protein
MPFEFLVWLLALLCQAGNLGCTLYQLVNLSDLEMDHLNPHSATRNFNSVSGWALVSKVGFGSVLLLSGKWLLGLIGMAMVLYEMKTWGRMDPVDAYRVLRERKASVTKKTAISMVLFVWSLWRFLETIVLNLVSHHGQAAAAAVLREAAATLYH